MTKQDWNDWFVRILLWIVVILGLLRAFLR